MALVGGTMFEASLKGADLASALVDAMGGLDATQKGFDAYFQAMFTDQERSARTAEATLRNVNAQFTLMGVAVPQNRSEFRALFEQMSAIGDSGAVVTLLNMSDAMGQVFDTAEKAAQAMKDLAAAQSNLNNDLILRNLNLNGQTEAAAFFELQQKQIKEMTDAIAAGLDISILATTQERERAELLKRYQGETNKALDESNKAQLQAVVQLQTALVNSLKNTINQIIDYQTAALEMWKGLKTGELSTLSPEQKYRQLQDQVASATLAASLSTPADQLSAAQLAARQSLPALIQQMLEASRGYNASGAGYQSDYLSATDTLAKLAEFGPDGRVRPGAGRLLPRICISGRRDKSII
jgi:hypothetical protein